jgi:hypothetical protein
MSGSIRRFFGDATYEHRLGIAELRELEEETRVGLGVVHARLQTTSALPLGDLFLRDTQLVLRLGLAGGGMDKERAALMVERHVKPPHLFDCSRLAFLVLSAALLGHEDDPEGETEGRWADGTSPSPTVEPPGGSSTETPPS